MKTGVYHPTPNELLPPPTGRTGWPWTVKKPQRSDAVLDSASLIGETLSWPRVSIVTPSYNQGRFIEETIRSVLFQGYPNLEYIIMDGGSTDGSVEIIRKYEPWLYHWESRRDKGQSDAINRGFARSSGDILGWLNSDDTYEPGAINRLIRGLTAHPDHLIAHGHARYIDERGNRLPVRGAARPAFTRRYLVNRDPVVQPTSFWRKELWEKVGPLREDLNWGFDWDWYIRASAHTEFLFIPEYMANYRKHSLAKTQTQSRRKARHAELTRVSRQYGGWYQTVLYAASAPSYAMEEILGRSDLSPWLRESLMRGSVIFPRLLKRVLRLYYRS